MQTQSSRMLREMKKITLKNGTNFKICIQDVKNDIGQRKNVADFMLKYFYSTKPTAIASGVHKSQEALQELHDYLLNILAHLHCFGYYDLAKSGNSLVAVSLMRLVTKSSGDMPKPRIVTKENIKQLSMTEDMQSSFDVMKEFGVDSFYSDFGLAATPEYQNLGIALNIAQIRHWICEQDGVPLTSAWATAIGTQKAAVRFGYKTVFQIPSEKFAQRYNVVFKDAPTFFKLMVKETNI